MSLCGWYLTGTGVSAPSVSRNQPRWIRMQCTHGATVVVGVRIYWAEVTAKQFVRLFSQSSPFSSLSVTVITSCFGLLLLLLRIDIPPAAHKKGSIAHQVAAAADFGVVRRRHCHCCCYCSTCTVNQCLVWSPRYTGASRG